MRQLLFLLFPLFLFAQEAPIAYCITIEGNVFAINLASLERPLSVSDPVFEGETIRTEEESRAQLKFTDDSLAVIPPFSRFQVSGYRYKKRGEADLFASELFEGGVQILSGSIAKKNPRETKLKTPNATLGLRGTLIEAKIAPSSREVFFGVQEGRAIIFNASGSILIGQGELSQFAFVRTPDTAPRFLFNRPAELDPEGFRLPSGAIPMQSAPPVLTTPSSRPPPSVAPSTPSTMEGGPPPETDVIGRKRGGGVSIQRGC